MGDRDPQPLLASSSNETWSSAKDHAYPSPALMIIFLIDSDTPTSVVLSLLLE